jgi:aminopeptidase N
MLVRFASLLALCLMLGRPLAAAAQPRFEFDKTAGNLPKTVLPLHYRLALEIDPARDRFGGHADIRLRVREPVAAITLHARQLEAASARLVAGGRTRALTVDADEASQTWRLSAADGKPIKAGEYRVEIEYSGLVRQVGEGLYRADYTAQGQPARMLATQLEAVSARKVFPAFDEPAFRAVFEISVRSPKGYEVLSNMPLARKLDKPDKGGSVLHRFAPTPPMPSYLVAVALGHFDSLEGEAAGVPLRVLTAQGKREQARYALQVTRQVLPFYTEYFGVPFALPKLDQLAVAAVRRGAMEDWGLISYAEPVVLFDPARSSPRTQRWAFGTVAHEVAHQWFGNLVTAASWDEIWLNEAFATWLANKASERFNPTWQEALHHRFPLDETMQTDAGAATRAIRSGPVSERSVWDVFDGITYVKGGAVLSMLEQWLGADTFRRGLRAYMRDRRLSNATAGDLWHAMSKVSDQDIGALAASWTDQPGFPMLKVQTRCEKGQTRVSLAQSRFSLGAAEPSSGGLWKVPVRLWHGGRDLVLLLDKPEQGFLLPGCPAEPMRVNAGGAGYYRVQYAPEHLQALSERFAALPPIDQVTLLSDTFALAQAAQAPIAAPFTLMAMIPRVHRESRATLYMQAGEALRVLDAAFAGTPAQAKVRAAGRQLLAPELVRVGWEPKPEDEPETAGLRGALIEALAQFDEPAVIEQAQRRFDLDQAGETALPAQIRAAVVNAVGMHADGAHFEHLLDLLKRAGGEEDRQLYAKSLSRGRNAERAQRLLETTLTGIAPSNVATRIPEQMSRLSPFADMAYRFTLANFEALSALTGDGGKSELLPNAAAGFNDAANARTLVEDQRKLAPDGTVPAAQAAAQIELAAVLKQRDAPALDKLLTDWRPTP